VHQCSAQPHGTRCRASAKPERRARLARCCAADVMGRRGACTPSACERDDATRSRSRPLRTTANRIGAAPRRHTEHVTRPRAPGPSARAPRHHAEAQLAGAAGCARVRRHRRRHHAASPTRP
jgi:hypothetical protein